MSQKIVDNNEDIKKLVEAGFAVSIDGNFLIIRDIPYLDSNLAECLGAIVTKLIFIDNEHVNQDDHEIFFAGSVPYGLDGKPISTLGGGSAWLHLSKYSEDVIVQRSFSNKPKITGGFKDFYDKINHYVSVICRPAIEKYNSNPYLLNQNGKVIDIKSD